MLRAQGKQITMAPDDAGYGARHIITLRRKLGMVLAPRRGRMPTPAQLEWACARWPRKSRCAATIRITPHAIEMIKEVPPVGNRGNVPASLMSADKKYSKQGLAHGTVYRRLLKNKPFITITGFRKAMPAHPTPHELPSAKTVARIQTFLDGFEFMRGVSNMRHQASGAVPVMPAMNVGEAMLAHLHSTMQAAPAACRMERR